jgi:[ribosomal protein S5]-alanine N-acetyltransferase
MSQTEPVIETERLRLFRFAAEDAPFALTLVGGPTFIRYIGDKGVRTLDDARAYLANGPLASYARFGFGLFKVERTADGTPIGMCGLLKRDTLEDPDLGYAFLPEYWSQGYAREAAAATVEYGRRVHGLARIVAVTDPDNAASAAVLRHIGFEFERPVRMGAADKDVLLFGSKPL